MPKPIYTSIILGAIILFGTGCAKQVPQLHPVAPPVTSSNTSPHPTDGFVGTFDDSGPHSKEEADRIFKTKIQDCLDKVEFPVAAWKGPHSIGDCLFFAVVSSGTPYPCAFMYKLLVTPKPIPELDLAVQSCISGALGFTWKPDEPVPEAKVKLVTELASTLKYAVFHPVNKLEDQMNTPPSRSESAPPAGSCIPVEVYPGYTTCVMSESPLEEHPTSKFGKDEARDDNNPDKPHEESVDPDPSRD